MTTDAVEYLKGIADRTIAYDSVREYVLSYAADHEAWEEECLLSLLVVAFIWEAKHRKESLTEDKLNLLLGVDEDEHFTLDDLDCHQEVTLSEDRADLDLDELLDLTLFEYLKHNEEDDNEDNDNNLIQ